MKLLVKSDLTRPKGANRPRSFRLGGEPSMTPPNQTINADGMRSNARESGARSQTASSPPATSLSTGIRKVWRRVACRIGRFWGVLLHQAANSPGDKEAPQDNARYSKDPRSARKRIVLRAEEATTQIGESSPWAPEVIIGMDVGDEWSNLCVLKDNGQTLYEVRIRTTKEGICEHCTPEGLHTLVVLEAGNQSIWISQLLKDLGCEVLLASPDRLIQLYRKKNRTDRLDAQRLAKLGFVDPAVLAPVNHLEAQTYADRCLLYGRAHLVAVRTKLINFVRGQSKVAGGRIGKVSSNKFPGEARRRLPEHLIEALEPVLATIESVNHQIRELDDQISRAAKARYPVVERLTQVPGVGTRVAMSYVLTLEDPLRFNDGKRVASYLGLAPRQHESGAKHVVVGPGNAGDRLARRYLIQAAQYHLWKSKTDTSIQRMGLRIVSGGGEGAKSRAVFAVARKLSVLMHTLWITGNDYQPSLGTTL